MNKNSRFLILLGTGFLAVFLGAFLAFALIINQLINNSSIVYQNKLSNHIINAEYPDPRFYNDIDRQVNDLIRETQKMYIMPDLTDFNPSPTVKTENTKEAYKVLVNLKHFGGDENNIKVNVDKTKVTVSAKYERKRDNRILSTSSFYQTFTVQEKIDASKIKKERDGDSLLIIIPKTTTADPGKDKNIEETFPNLDKDFI